MWQDGVFRDFREYAQLDERSRRHGATRISGTRFETRGVVDADGVDMI